MRDEQTNKQTLKIELLSQWKLEAEFRNIYADVDAISMTPSRNTRSYTLRSVPSSPGRSFLATKELYT